MRKMNILLIAGGWSTEREISLLGAKSIAETLKKCGHTVTLFDLSEGFPRLCELASRHEVAFINLHGQPGEDGLVQALLERVHCPYQGSNPAGSFLALNKAAAKALFQSSGIPTPKYVFFPSPVEDKIDPQLSFPCFVKANNGGSSIYLYKVNSHEELMNALETIHSSGREALVEEFIKGRELTCGVLEYEGGPKALPPVLIVPKRDYFDYHDKYASDGAAEICPAPLSKELTEKVQELALKAHICLGLSGYSRTDFILSDEGSLYALETNTLPGMTSASLIPKEAAAIGMTFAELLEHLLFLAVKRAQHS